MYSPIASPKPDTCASAFEAQYLTVKHVDGHSLFCQNKHFQLCWYKAANFLKKASPPSRTPKSILSMPFSSQGALYPEISCAGAFVWSPGRHQRNICGKYSDLIHPHTYTWFGMMWYFPSYHSIRSFVLVNCSLRNSLYLFLAFLFNYIAIRPTKANFKQNRPQAFRCKSSFLWTKTLVICGVYSGDSTA